MINENSPIVAAITRTITTTAAAVVVAAATIAATTTTTTSVRTATAAGITSAVRHGLCVVGD